MRLNVRMAARLINATLLSFLAAVYVAAKLHLFMHYGSLNYVREHSVYWVLAAIIALLILVFERLSVQQPR